MTRTLAFEMLAQGNTGAEILDILDVIQQDTVSSRRYFISNYC